MPVSVRRSPFERVAREGLNNKRAAEERLAEESSNYSGIQNRATLGGTRPEGAWIPDFLGALTRGLPVRRAVKVAGVHETLVYQRRAKDEKFRSAWNEACELGTELLEQEAQRRAYHGTLKPIYQKGVLCGVERKFSDTLMIFLLKGRKPEVYRDGVEDSDRRDSFVLNINVVPATEDAPPTVVVQAKQEPAGLVEVSAIGDAADGDKQDGQGVREAAAIS